jgi:hypothetical protein
MKKNHSFNLSFFTSRLLSALILVSVSTIFANSSAAQIDPGPVPPVPRLPSSWLVVDSPNGPDGNTTLSGVACAASNDCWAVGASFEHWDGNAWTVVDSSAALGATASVTCIASNDCWAVGSRYSPPSPLIQHWDGNSWTVTPNVPATGDYSGLNSVTCTSGSNCWAVGYYHSQAGRLTLIQHWNGSAWQFVNSPNGSLSALNKYLGAMENTLAGVACASESKCWAVGSYEDDVGRTTLTEQWDGTSWTVVPSTGITAASVNGRTPENSLLTSVTCPSAIECWAVGYSATPEGAETEDSQPLFEHWVGGAWHVLPSPTLGNSSNINVAINSYPWNSLSSVQCSSATQCWAVGSSRTDPGNGSARTLIEQWNGAAWAPVTSPNSNTSDLNFLRGVTCVPGSECWAVGSSVDANGSSRPLVLLNP